MKKWCNVVLATIGCLVPMAASAVQHLEPWYPEYMVFELEADLAYQHYSSIELGDSRAGYAHSSSTNKFFDLSLMISPLPNWCWELELLFASTARESFGLNSARVTGRHLLMDDVVGDPFSLSLGGSIDLATSESLKDLSIFNHGHFNTELQLAIGKEVVNLEAPMLWEWHFWGVGGVGAAERGRPWLRWDLNIERNFDDWIRVKVFADALYGSGSRNMTEAMVKDFDGYATVRHQSIDLGFKITQTLELWGELAFSFAHRAHARNAPESVNTYVLSYTLPFSL